MFKPSNKDVVFSLLSISIVCFADITREFFPASVNRWKSASIVLRWTTYYILMLLTLLCGVFDSSQFIYVSF